MKKALIILLPEKHYINIRVYEDIFKYLCKVYHESHIYTLTDPEKLVSLCNKYEIVDLITYQIHIDDLPLKLNLYCKIGDDRRDVTDCLIDILFPRDIQYKKLYRIPNFKTVKEYISYIYAYVNFNL